MPAKTHPYPGKRRGRPARPVKGAVPEPGVSYQFKPRADGTFTVVKVWSAYDPVLKNNRAYRNETIGITRVSHDITHLEPTPRMLRERRSREKEYRRDTAPEKLASNLPGSKALGHPVQPPASEAVTAAAGKNLKRNPYGIAAFVNVRTENYAYADKTRFIERLEALDTKTPLLVRPRRFGKTLFTKMLRAYYDKAAAGSFKSCFAGTWIADHLTPLASSYYVFSIDFSGILADNFTQGMINRLKDCVADFTARYKLTAGTEILAKNYADVTILFGDFLRAFTLQFGGPAYLIIDEYDQAANEVLARDVKSFKRLTSAGGELKAFYAYLKDRVADGTVDRVFITGVTSMSLDSMTSGFNIATNITSMPVFASLAGFTEEELRQLVPQIMGSSLTDVSAGELIAKMKDWYNGYRFSAWSSETVFNASMCLYYLASWKDYGCEPEVLLDPAVASDLSKIRGILRLGDTAAVEEIVKTALTRKPLEFISKPDVLKLQPDNRLNRQDILTALLYFGYLTYAPESRTQLVIPNRAMAQQFFDVYFDLTHGAAEWNTARRSLFDKALHALPLGDARPAAEAAASWLSASYGTHKNLNLREGDFQTALLQIANWAAGYEAYGEVEVLGQAAGFIDVLLRSRTGGFSYVFELKYLSQSEKAKHPEAVSARLEEAREQLSRYLQAENIRSIPSLKAAAAVYAGMRLEAFDSWNAAG